MIFAFAMIALTGCGLSPEKVVIKFADHLMQRDLDGAKRYATKDFAGTLSSMESIYAAMGSNPYEGRTSPVTEEDLESEIQSDTAYVWMKEVAFMRYVLKKERGFWKIDGFDIDFGALNQAIQELPEELRNQMPPIPQR
jgi:hypothetical protein